MRSKGYWNTNLRREESSTRARAAVEDNLGDLITNQAFVRRLAFSVLLIAIRDAISDKMVRRAALAKKWLLEESPVLEFWCSASGIRKGYVRKLLRELETRKVWDPNVVKFRLKSLIEMSSGSTYVPLIHDPVKQGAE